MKFLKNRVRYYKDEIYKKSLFDNHNRKDSYKYHSVKWMVFFIEKNSWSLSTKNNIIEP